MKKHSALVLLLVVTVFQAKPARAQNLKALDETLYLCLALKMNAKPRDMRDPTDPYRALDMYSGRKFFYDTGKQSWFDIKTGECICPNCPQIQAMPPHRPPKGGPIAPPPPPAPPYPPAKSKPQPSDAMGGSLIPRWFGIKLGMLPKMKGKPQPNAQAFKAGGSLDPCLVGDWRSEPVGANMLGVSGGGGIRVTFKADGTQTVNYDGMQPFQGRMGETNAWTGEAEGRIATDKGVASVQSVERSSVMHKYDGPNGSRSNPLTGGLGPAGLGNNRFDPSYTCNETRLTYKDPARTFVFLRLDKNGEPIEGPKPAEPAPVPTPEGLALPGIPDPIRKNCEPEYSQALKEAEQKARDAAGARKLAESFRSSGMSTRKAAQGDRQLAEQAADTLIVAVKNGDKAAEANIREQIDVYNQRAQLEEASAEYDLQKAASEEQRAKDFEQAAETIRRDAAQECLNKSGSK